MMGVDATALALIAERITGYPPPLYQRFGHPIEWIGKAIGLLEGGLNKPEVAPWIGRARGMLCVLILLIAASTISGAVDRLLALIPGGWILEAALAIPFLAQRAMYEHVAAVAAALDRSLAEARTAVSMIVGRDPESLDEPGIARAALESLAENTSDGIVAPAFWFLIGGLPGLVLYKVINTADSMIGHKSERYRYFGWAAARLDDLVNLPASRLTGLLFAGAALFTPRASARAAIDAMWRDAGKHLSPNAGWPESALAGALGIRLGGPRAYQGQTVDLASMGDGRSDLDRADIRRGLRLYSRMLTLLAVISLILAWTF